MSAPAQPGAACAACLARSWLLARLAGHLDRVGRRLESVLELDDAELIAALAGRDERRLRAELAAFAPDAARAECRAAGLAAVCRCDPAYPPALRALSAPPAVLYTGEPGAGRLGAVTAGATVAIVGARRASPYGREVARSLARGLGAAGVTVISGMAAGVDAAAHEGALDAQAATVAVLAAAPERAYPAGARVLHRRISAVGAVVSELGPGVTVRRWMFPARNRVIAALSAMTVVVAARPGSGALLTARAAADLGRVIGAVPGPVTAPLSSGPHALLRAGARLVTGPEDVLDALGELGPGSAAGWSAAGRSAAGRNGAGRSGGPPAAPPLQPALAELLAALGDGHELSAAFALAGLDPERGLAALAALELAGRVRRAAGGLYAVVP